MNKCETVTNAQQKSKAGWTPYDGMEVKGWPIMTIIRGNTVMRDEELIGSPMGQPIKFRETLMS